MDRKKRWRIVSYCRFSIFLFVSCTNDSFCQAPAKNRWFVYFMNIFRIVSNFLRSAGERPDNRVVVINSLSSFVNVRPSDFILAFVFARIEKAFSGAMPFASFIKSSRISFFSGAMFWKTGLFNTSSFIFEIPPLCHISSSSFS